MATFALFCLDKPDAMPRRLAAREAHLAHVREHAAIIKLAGPLLDDAGEMTGSMFVMEAASRAEVEAFAAQDPYKLADVFERVDIRGYKITVGAIQD